MQEPNQYPGVDPYAVKTIRCAARRLVGRHGFRLDDIEDLEQEMLCHLYSQWDRHNPDRGTRDTFIAKVISRKVAQICKYRRVRNNHDGELDLDQIVPEVPEEALEEENATPLELTSGIDGRAPRGLESALDHLRGLELRLDVEKVLAGLPGPLRDICERLQSETPTQIARDGQMSRRAIYWCVQCIRTAMVEAGLDPGLHFFEKPTYRNGGSAINTGYGAKNIQTGVTPRLARA